MNVHQHRATTAVDVYRSRIKPCMTWTTHLRTRRFRMPVLPDISVNVWQDLEVAAVVIVTITTLLKEKTKLDKQIYYSPHWQNCTSTFIIAHIDWNLIDKQQHSPSMKPIKRENIFTALNNIVTSQRNCLYTPLPNLMGQLSFNT